MKPACTCPQCRARKATLRTSVRRFWKRYSSKRVRNGRQVFVYYASLLLVLASCKRYIPTTVPVVIPADSLRFTTSICDTLHDTVTHRINNTTVRLIREPGALHVRVVRDSIRTTVQAECPPLREQTWMEKNGLWLGLAVGVSVVLLTLWLGKR